VRSGEVFGFMGHNGAGKTTTLRMLLGLLQPTSGIAHVLGHDVVSESLAIRRVTGFLPGEFGLPRDTTARRFLRYIGAMFGMRGAGLEQCIDALLAQFGVSSVADARLGTFSSGMSQKVGLAQALINEPRVLLLDEPTSGLDPIGRHDLLALVRQLARERGVTGLFSTHILSDVEQICERVAILNHGSLIAAGELADLKQRNGIDRMDDLYLALVRRAA
jgi:ABC-2 type transport system ATP-binding protein